jgi:hypothetical protein
LQVRYKAAEASNEHGARLKAMRGKEPMAHTKARPKYATPIVHGILAMTVAAVLVASCEPDHARTQVTVGAAEEEPRPEKVES